MSQYISGRIVKLFCQPKANNWFAGIIRTRTGEELKISGAASIRVAKGMTVEFEGIFKDDDKYGGEWSPLKGTVITQMLTSKADVIGFLSSSLFPSVTKRTAEKLYDCYGEDTISVLQSNLDAAAQTCKLKQSQITALHEGLNASIGAARLVRAFPHMRVKTAEKILNTDKDLNANKVIDDVRKYGAYKILDIYGVSFLDIDTIAIEDCKESELCDDRIALMVEKSIYAFCCDKNATYVRINDTAEWQDFFYNYFMSLRVYKEFPSVVNGRQFNANFLATWIHDKLNCSSLEADAVPFFVSNPMANSDGTFDVGLYTRKMAEAEHSIVKAVADAAEPDVFMTSSYDTVRKYVYQAKKSGEYTNYSDEQIEAATGIFKSTITFISGGPGRGKTHTVSLALDLWRMFQNGDILLLAPTGRAVNKIKAASGYDRAETVARFILMNTKEAAHCINNNVVLDNKHVPIERKHASLIIVDESSMLDFITAAKLFEIAEGMSIVFVGDKNQLPPIEPGAFFTECIKSDKVNKYTLTKNFRTDSVELSDNADAIIQKDTPVMSDFKFSLNFQTLNCAEYPSKEGERSQAEQFILSSYRGYMADGADFTDIMVIAPFSNAKYGLSSSNLNRLLQDEINPLVSHMPKFGYDDYGAFIDMRGCMAGVSDKTGVVMRIGDKVMNMRNNTSLGWNIFKNDNNGFECDDITPDTGCEGVFNGDSGTIIKSYPPTGERNTYLLCIALDDTRSEAQKMIDKQPTRYVYVSAELNSKGISMIGDWSLGYAMTVHKAQGGEAKHVIVAMSERGYKNTSFLIKSGKAPFLTKNMIYTAITRAKETVMIVGSNEAFLSCAGTECASMNVRLCEKIEKAAVI